MINKNGNIEINTNGSYLLVNNFSASGNTNGWDLGGTLSNGVVTLTGTAPSMTSSSFTVGPNEIVVVEFDLTMTSPSSSGDGLHFGIATNSNTIRYYYIDNNWNSGTDNASSSWNTYFIGSWHRTDPIHVKSYILGQNIDIAKVPPPFITNSLTTVSAIKLKNYTTTNLRAGYNTNTTMTMLFSNPKIYNIGDKGLYESDRNLKIYSGGLEVNNIIEI